MKKLLIATSNNGKFIEISEIIQTYPALKNLQLFSLNQLKITGTSPETGSTFSENALQKARYYAKTSGYPTLAEDSGIIVDALKNELGIKTRRWGKGESATDQEWVDYFLKRMAEVPDKMRTAAFICAAAFIDQNGKEYLHEGITRGQITRTLEAIPYKGLPLSGCFKPENFEIVYSAMSIWQKNTVSHRGKAVKPLLEIIAGL